MSARSGARARAGGRESATLPRLTAGAIYTAVCVVLAALAAWPVYATGAYLLLVVVSAAVATGVVALVSRRSWGGWALTAALAAAFAVLAVPLAVPSRMTSVPEGMRGLGEAFAGVVVAWKDLVTVDLPVGAYRNLLVPALVVFLVGTVLTLALSVRSDRRALVAVLPGSAMTGFGLFFGRSATSAPLSLGPVEVAAPTETAVGLGAFLAAMLWLAWRARDERVRALSRASARSAVHVTRGPSLADRRRAALGLAMVVTAVVVTVAVVPAAARDADRRVLRSAAGPDRQIAEAVSPLAAYRALFSDTRSDDVLFRVTRPADAGAGELPERIRIATLDTYDGETFRASGDAGGGFVRLPSSRDAGDGRAVDADVEIVDLGGSWMPTAGRLSEARFDGDRRTLLADRFYYSADAQAGVQIADGGLRTGDRYRLDAVEPGVDDLVSLSPPGDTGGPAGGDNLRRWVEQNASGSGGAALQGLVQLLRERGYLSHSLALEGSAPPRWTEDLPGYRLQPSASGHSVARIDRMFERLLEREDDPRAAASDNFVAAIGDDEQFSVATALIAHELGFPARVVVGARLSAADASLSTCDAGECRARDVTAWTEVQGSDGAWTPVDVTPQWEKPPSLEVTQQQDPENVTEVRPDTVEEVVPPDPVQEDDALDDDERTDDGVDLAWLWALARVGAIGLLLLVIVFGPFLTVIVAKLLRRRGRRLDPDPRSAIAGGWDEYVDSALDSRRVLPSAPTRREVAEVLATPRGIRLADDADRAVFSPRAVTAEEAADFWRIVDDERRALRRRQSMWQRMRSAVSLRSFLGFLAPVRRRRRPPHRDERGKRSTAQVGRDTT